MFWIPWRWAVLSPHTPHSLRKLGFVPIRARFVQGFVQEGVFLMRISPSAMQARVALRCSKGRVWPTLSPQRSPRPS